VLEAKLIVATERGADIGTSPNIRGGAERGRMEERTQGRAGGNNEKIPLTLGRNPKVLFGKEKSVKT